VRSRGAAPPTRIGVVGCGTIAYWTHLRTLARLRDVRVVAAADPDPAARERARAVCGATLHASHDELLARADLDAVVLCAPTPVHAELAIAACRRGLPFYLEKPLAGTASDGRAILAAARDAGVVAALGFNRRRHPVHERARALLLDGRIGRVATVLSAFCEPMSAAAMPAWTRRRDSGGGALLDLGSHHVDLVRWMLDDEIAEVGCRITTTATEDDDAWLELGTRRGVEVRSAFSLRSGPADWLTFVGERGTIHVDRFRCALELRTTRRFGYGLRRVPLRPRASDAAWRARRLVRPSFEPSYARALADFVAEVRGGPARSARLDDGARALDVVLAAEDAARRGTRTAVREARDADPARD
jgi:predicted dehydrogenase